MKIKYSNTVKREFSKDILSQCIQLTLSIKQNAGMYIYDFKNINNNLQISQTITSINYEREITIERTSMYSPQTTLLVYRSNDCLYLMTLEDIYNP